ncbi:hypothetical protein NDU88_002716 [Pleurodeles waltl]|uniref:Uncharacterized protein n=1 Tax=Pleurodeles waltl TaxID=8319 RepID=A0AAV7T2N7_PLEWA|nr:hypothetical protein NDU88_002716 [Pleurodeles waltl]
MNWGSSHVPSRSFRLGRSGLWHDRSGAARSGGPRGERGKQKRIDMVGCGDILLLDILARLLLFFLPGPRRKRGKQKRIDMVSGEEV